ncbi:MAG: radical SAM protein [Desulfobulbaceae bacterium]|nr:MAG: radical SAM protein [Desulfobulbaceae bacterium]
MNSVRTIDLEKHPCFNPDVKGQYGRVHLPVAPKCNIKCNFCDRKYDCVNESRPGVTSAVLTPVEASIYMDRVVEKEPRITVAGIAGPGDPFANGDQTMETLRRIRQNHPEMILCLSSNGMGIKPYIPEIKELEVSHVTITVCAVDPTIGAKIYRWVKDGTIIYHGIEGATRLLSRQLEAIEILHDAGITVKVNAIVIPGVNDHHIIEVARVVKEKGADLLNCMALFPNVNTPFGELKQPAKSVMNEIVSEAEKILPQMKHCTRCRADAVGLLGEDRTEEFRGCLTMKPALIENTVKEKRYVGVATREGVLINQHLGEADSFEIWQQHDGGFEKFEVREAPKPGGGIKRWHQLALLLHDCRAVLISGIGQTPADILTKSGVIPVEASGFIEEGLKVIYENKKSTLLKGRRTTDCSTCSGTGSGCV